MVVREAWRTWSRLITRNASSSIEGDTSIKYGDCSLVFERASLCEVDVRIYSTYNLSSEFEKDIVTFIFRRVDGAGTCNFKSKNINTL